MGEDWGVKGDHQLINTFTNVTLLFSSCFSKILCVCVGGVLVDLNMVYLELETGPSTALSIFLWWCEPSILFVNLDQRFKALLGSCQTILTLCRSKLNTSFSFYQGRWDLHDECLDGVCWAPPLFCQQFHANCASKKNISTWYDGMNDTNEWRFKGISLLKNDI